MNEPTRLKTRTGFVLPPKEPEIVEAPPQKLFYASTWHRAFANLVDTFLIVLVYVAFCGSNYLELTRTGETTISWLSLAMPCLIGISYQTLFWIFKGATPGKMLFDLKVVNFWDAYGPLPWSAALIRSLSVLVLSTVLGVFSAGCAFFRNDRRQLADLIAGTIVLQSYPRKEKPKVRYVLGVLTALSLFSAVHNVQIALSSLGPDGIHMTLPKHKPTLTRPN